VVRSALRTSLLLAGVISVLALADGILHFTLDFVLFQGNLFGRLGQGGGGGPSPLPLPTNQLFALNLLGYAVLVLLLWFVAPRLGARSWLIDVLFLVYIGLVFAGWLRMGAPNPRGYLGYLSKSIELVLVLALLTRLWTSRASSRAAAALRGA
jgi:hypothetical protein